MEMQHSAFSRHEVSRSGFPVLQSWNVVDSVFVGASEFMRRLLFTILPLLCVLNAGTVAAQNPFYECEPVVDCEPVEPWLVGRR